MSIEDKMQEIKAILESNKEDEIVFEKCLELIESLTKIAIANNPNEVCIVIDDFINCKTMNYLSDEKLSKISLEKWSKEDIVGWLTKYGLKYSLQGVYNINALVLGMNYEYMVHKTFIESTGDAPMTAYKLAEGALNQEGYIDNIID